MFNQNEFIRYIEKEFNVDWVTIDLINNCVCFIMEHHQEDFVNKLYELLDNTIGIEKEEIEEFYE